MTITWKGDEEGVLKLITFLRILLFLNNRSIVYFCGWRGWRGWRVGGAKLVISCGRGKCMSPNIGLKWKWFKSNAVWNACK